MSKLSRQNKNPRSERTYSPVKSVPGDNILSYRKNVSPLGENQKELMEAISIKRLVLAIGPAGTGKTYIAVCKAVDLLKERKVNKILLSRPALEAGDKLGYLPGELKEKMDPYLRPLYDILDERIGSTAVKAKMDAGEIEVAPISFMRGRTFSNSVVVLDEAQNCTYQQLKMAVTRIGWNTTMIITGDPQQSDLPEGVSGLSELCRRLEGFSRSSIVRFSESDSVRSELVKELLTRL